MGSIAVVHAAGPVERGAVERSLRAAPHRGGELEVHVDGRTGLGSRTCPTSPTRGPHDGTGRPRILTGSLDNRAEVEAALGPSADPAETVLAAFDAWGMQAPARLRGVFAGAWTDGTELVVFRDQLGLAPLFHHESAETFVAATEGKQVAAGAGIPREPDVDSVEAMFFGRFDARRTMLRGVDRFPRASTATLAPGRSASFARYWDPNRSSSPPALRPPEARERLAELIDRAVARSLTGSDAISLSGGIDSPTIAAFAGPKTQELTGAPLLAVSSVYPDDPGVDESRWIELVTEHLGLRLHAYTPTSRPLDDVEHWVDVLDGPVDTMSIPELAENYRLARELGARNVLTGEMAEWVFTFGQHLIGHLVLHGRARASAAWARDQRGRGASWRRLLKNAAPSLVSPRLALGYRRLRGREDFRQLPPWVDPEVAGSPGPRPDLARPARRRWLEHQLDPLVGVGAYSFDADALCAAVCGVSVRRPLVDLDLWEFMLSLPAEIKFPDALPKSLLRESVRGRLPDELLDRTDKTFFNDFALRTADYEGIRRLTVESALRIGGVDYQTLDARLETEKHGRRRAPLGLRPRARTRVPGALVVTPPGACYGFEVRSSLPLAYLRDGTGDPLEIAAPADEGEGSDDVLLMEWRPTSGLPLEARLYAAGRAFRLWIAGGGWFSIDPEARRIEAPADGGLRTEERLWGIPALLCFRDRGDLPLHAAAIEVDGGAVLLAAPRTYGKTTMAAAFHREGHRVLSEDTSCVRAGPEPAIVPGPAMLRVRHDVAERLALPRARRLGQDDDRVHYALEEPGDCTPVPLRAAVFLDEATGAAGLEPVEQPEAIRDLWALSFRLPTEQSVADSFTGIVDLAASVPAFRLRRPLDLDALDDHVALVVAGV